MELVTDKAEAKPVPEGYARWTNKEIRRKFKGLQMLANSDLPSPEAEQKVAILMRRYFEPAFEITEDMIKARWRRLPIPEDYEGTQLPVKIQEARSFAQDEVLQLTQDIKVIPEALQLKKADLPKSSKALPTNKVALSDILASLGEEIYPELFDLDTEKEEKE